MRKQLTAVLGLVMVLMLGLALAACSRNANTPKDRVDKALDNANIKGVSTEYDRDANVIHLQGTVQSAEAKQRAEQLATEAVGTSGRVLDELKVEGMESNDVVSARDDTIRDALKDRVDKDQVLRDRRIDFDVNNGVVTVKGEVRTPEEKTKVTEIVRSIPGVKQMANELDVSPQK